MKLESSLCSILIVAAAGALLAGCGGGSATVPLSVSSAPTPTRTIIMVWDGLRPDSVTATDTPNLYALRQTGANFSDNHATYPSFTMMNGSSFATGSFPDQRLLRQHLLDPAAGKFRHHSGRQQRRRQQPGLPGSGVHRGLPSPDHAQRLLRRPTAAGENAVRHRAKRRHGDRHRRQVRRGLHSGSRTPPAEIVLAHGSSRGWIRFGMDIRFSSICLKAR